MWLLAPVLILLAAAISCSGVWVLHFVHGRIRGRGDQPGTTPATSPARVADWPELRLDAVVTDPEGKDRVLVIARRPNRPDLRTLLVLDLDGPAPGALQLLFRWRDTNASVSPRGGAGERLVLSARRGDDSVSACVVRETICAGQR